MRSRAIAHFNANRKKITGKWKPIILIVISGNKLRFNKIKQLVPGISANVLVVNLRELERDGLLIKEGTLYSPTELAERVVVCLLELYQILSS